MGSQLKQAERFGGIPSDEWLDSKHVYDSKKKHLQLLNLLSESNVLILDAGCSAGTYGLILAEKCTVIGVDISKIAVDKANERAKNKKLPFIAIENDLESLPFEDEKFDIIFLGWTLHHFPSLDKVCSELYRVLKKGGKIAIAEPNESNLLMRFSRFVEDALRPIVLKIKWDTPNRTIHTYKEYVGQFEKLGFTNIELSSCHVSLPPIFPSKSLKNIPLKIIYAIRSLSFAMGDRMLPKPMNGTDLMITGVKS
jgi:ubiquinone/menaquinone biosynthesis C-methylase UbiE